MLGTHTESCQADYIWSILVPYSSYFIDVHEAKMLINIFFQKWFTSVTNSYEKNLSEPVEVCHVHTHTSVYVHIYMCVCLYWLSPTE